MDYTDFVKTFNCGNEDVSKIQTLYKIAIHSKLTYDEW